MLCYVALYYTRVCSFIHHHITLQRFSIWYDLILYYLLHYLILYHITSYDVTSHHATWSDITLYSIHMCEMHVVKCIIIYIHIYIYSIYNTLFVLTCYKALICNALNIHTHIIPRAQIFVSLSISMYIKIYSLYVRFSYYCLQITVYKKKQTICWAKKEKMKNH